MPTMYSPYGYLLRDGMYACPECANEWNSTPLAVDDELVVKDSNGNNLKNGDSVIVIKNLPVKSASGPIKSGTKVQNIKLVEGDHNIDCKIPGFGGIGLKSEFVKKA